MVRGTFSYASSFAKATEDKKAIEDKAGIGRFIFRFNLVAVQCAGKKIGTRFVSL